MRYKLRKPIIAAANVAGYITLVGMAQEIDTTKANWAAVLILLSSLAYVALKEKGETR